MKNKLQEKRQETETEHGEEDGQNKVDIPVSGLQQQLQVDHQHHGLAHCCLQRPQVSLRAREPKHRGVLGRNRSKVTSQLENGSSAFRAVGFKVI